MLPYTGFDFLCFLSAILFSLLTGNEVLHSELMWRVFFYLKYILFAIYFNASVLFWLVFSQYAFLACYYSQMFCICLLEV